jgi:hypothetical protein
MEVKSVMGNHFKRILANRFTHIFRNALRFGSQASIHVAANTPLAEFLNMLTAKASLSSLSPTLYAELSENVRVVGLPAGAELFDQGDAGGQTAFLLRGSIRMKSKDGVVHHVNSTDEMAHWPLAKLTPRLYEATITSDRTLVAWVDSAWLNRMVERNRHYTSPFVTTVHFDDESLSSNDAQNRNEFQLVPEDLN